MKSGKPDTDVSGKIIDLFSRNDAWRGIGKIMRGILPMAGDRAAVKQALQELVKQGVLQFYPPQRTYRLATYRSPQQRAAESPKPTHFEDGFLWPSAPGATLSENNAVKEYGVTHDELANAADAGKLHWLRNYAHGNPYNKLVRKEVEALVREKRGSEQLKNIRLNAELREVTTEIRSLKKKIVIAEKRKTELEAQLRS